MFRWNEFVSLKTHKINDNVYKLILIQLLEMLVLENLKTLKK